MDTNPMTAGRGAMSASPACKSCRGQCCTFAPMTRREFKTIRKKYGIPDGSTVVNIAQPLSVMVVRNMQDGVCSYLKDERCSIYEDRPWICRVYGDNSHFPCKLARPFEAQRKMDAIEKLRGMGWRE